MERRTRISPVRSASCRWDDSSFHDTTRIAQNATPNNECNAPAHTNPSVATAIMAYEEARKYVEKVMCAAALSSEEKLPPQLNGLSVTCPMCCSCSIDDVSAQGQP